MQDPEETKLRQLTSEVQSLRASIGWKNARSPLNRAARWGKQVYIRQLRKDRKLADEWARRQFGEKMGNELIARWNRPLDNDVPIT